jgi:DNA ligase D-like protein (predicted ligase)
MAAPAALDPTRTAHYAHVRMTARPARKAGRPLDSPAAGALRPMLPTLSEEPFDSADHIFEVKWGGVRAIAEIDDGEVRLHGGNLRDLTPLYPELAALPDRFQGRRAIVDGEIIAWGTAELPDFALLRPRLLRPDEPARKPKPSPVIYQVYDLLELDGRSLLERPLFERRNLLHERLRPTEAILPADFITENGVAFFEAVVAYKLEGMIAKDKTSPYLPGERSAAWQEVRAIQSDDFVIGGYTFGGGLRRKDLITSLLLGAYRDRELRFIGEVSVGCTDREMRQLQALLSPLHDDRAPFAEAPSVARLFYWCRPELACHVRYSQWGPDGQLRFPIFVSPRPDIAPEECLLP